MDTTAPAPAPAAVTARPVLDLDARMAAVEAEMTVRLQLAGLALDVDTAHLSAPLDLADVITGPVPLPEPEEDPYGTPAAATLQRAARRLRTGGWCQGRTVDADGARCLYGAVHAEAPSSRAEGDALAVLLDVIRRHFPGTDTVPEANDHRLTGWRSAVRILGEAATLADARGL
ncbi:hypothetical protein R6L23_25820 [Streptomyces sp. SR27]|uniref:DUF6197 family protein n=1 Tax=Streptomyces sp. SR27 TaxID=3076630 RepID=UPI00295BA13D|nr:hypothetical protein [Streptomyces sp. SR27]MDV9191583.1 hypothetical protein [Streptomyces sp. SR27]